MAAKEPVRPALEPGNGLDERSAEFCTQFRYVTDANVGAVAWGVSARGVASPISLASHASWGSGRRATRRGTSPSRAATVWDCREWVGHWLADPPERVAVDVIDQPFTVGHPHPGVLLV